MYKVVERRALTLKDKMNILTELDEHTGTRIQLASRLGIHVVTLNNIAKNRVEIQNSYTQRGPLAVHTIKRKSTMKLSPVDELETALAAWFKEARAAGNADVSGYQVREKALYLASRLGIYNFTASNGWIDRFKKRNSVVFKLISGKLKMQDWTIPSPEPDGTNQNPASLEPMIEEAVIKEELLAVDVALDPLGPIKEEPSQHDEDGATQHDITEGSQLAATDCAGSVTVKPEFPVVVFEAPPVEHLSSMWGPPGVPCSSNERGTADNHVLVCDALYETRSSSARGVRPTQPIMPSHSSVLQALGVIDRALQCSKPNLDVLNCFHEVENWVLSQTLQ